MASDPPASPRAVAGLDPYVSIRMGLHCRHHVQTRPVYQTDDNDQGHNVKWTSAHRNVLKIDRTKRDLGVMVLEVYDDNPIGRNPFIGGCQVDIIPYGATKFRKDDVEAGDETMEEADEDGWYSKDVILFDNGAENGDVSGTLKVRMKWIEDKTHLCDGYMMVHCSEGTDLVNPGAHLIRDMRNFSDSSALALHLAFAVLYLVVGTAFCSFYLKWNTLDSLVFLVTTFTTVGYGDHESDFTQEGYALAKVFVMVYILVGLGLLGAIVGVIGGIVAATLKRGKEAVATKMGDAINMANSHSFPTKASFVRLVHKNIEDEHAPDEEHDAAPTAAALDAAEDGFWDHMAFPLGILLLNLAVGALVYSWAEGMSYLDAMYFTIVTTSTVGYGDITPKTTIGKMFTIPYVPLGVCLLAYACHTIAEIPMQLRFERMQEHILGQFGEEMHEEDFEHLKRTVHKAPTENITKNDFSLAMLMRLGVVTICDLQRVEALFSMLDKDHSGELSIEDITELCAIAKVQLERKTSIDDGTPADSAASSTATGNPIAGDATAADMDGLE